MTNVIDLPGGRSPKVPSVMPDLDVARENRYSAHYFAEKLLEANLVNPGSVDQDAAKQALRLIQYGEPVRRFHNGQPIMKESAS